MIQFYKKKILVSGASSGIGRDISIQLSKLGAQVVLLGRNKFELEKTLSCLVGQNHQYFCYNLENIDNIKGLLEEIVSYDSIKLDGYVHSAGFASIYPLKNIDLNKMEKYFKISVYSYLEIVKHLSKKAFSNDNASIVYISSLATKTPEKGQILYVASKSAAESVAKIISKELVHRKIRVNNVLPCFVKTKMFEESMQYKTMEEKRHFKILEPYEVSNVVLYLLSDSSKYIIGENYYIDGSFFNEN